MIISHKYKFIFIKTRKTAGTSIEIFLSRFCGTNDVITPILPPEDGHYPRHYKRYFNPIREISAHNSGEVIKTLKDFFKRNKYYNHIPASRIKSRISDDIWHSYYKFCVERNPWDKTLSHYHWLTYSTGRKFSFSEYISTRKTRLNSFALFSNYMGSKSFCFNYPLYTDGLKHENIIVDYIAKYENLNVELTRIFRKLGIPFEGNLKIKAKSNYPKDNNSDEKFYSVKHRSQIDKIFRKEIEMHGYTFHDT